MYVSYRRGDRHFYVNYEFESTTRLKEKKLEISSGFPQYLRQNFQCKFAPQPIGSALLALPLTVRQ